MRLLGRSSARRGISPALKVHNRLKSLFFALLRCVHLALAKNTLALLDDLYLIAPYYTICLVAFNFCFHSLQKFFGRLRRERADSSISPLSLLPNREPEVFHLLDLPPELVAHCLTFLPTPDRLRTRVCSSLYQLESTGKYYEEVLDIARRGNNFFGGDGDPVSILLVIPESNADRSGTITALAKLANNVVFNLLSLTIDSEDDRWLIPYVQAIRHDEIMIIHRNLDTKGLVDDDSFDGWAAGKQVLDIDGQVEFTGEKLFQAYNDMESGRSIMWQLCLSNGPTAASCRRLMQLLGLTYHNGQFHSTRRDMEILELRSAVNIRDEGERVFMRSRDARSAFYLIMIGSRIKISVRKWIFDPPSDDDHRRFNDLAIEKFCEDGLCFECDSPALGLSVMDIRGNPKIYRRVLMTYE